MTTKKIALVTGASRGLGKDMAISLAHKGIDVILTYNSSKTEADKVVAEIEKTGNKAVALQFDVSNLSSFDGFLRQVSENLQQIWATDKIDFLINNAGIGGSIPIAQLTEDRFDEFMNVHFKGVCKSAIEVFSRYVAKEFGPRGIRSNVVAPGAIETDFNGALIRNNPQLQALIKSQTALGRVGKADDIGGVIGFLCSDDAKFVNGQRIEVSGGINL